VEASPETGEERGGQSGADGSLYDISLFSPLNFPAKTHHNDSSHATANLKVVHLTERLAQIYPYSVGLCRCCYGTAEFEQ